MIEEVEKVDVAKAFGIPRTESCSLLFRIERENCQCNIERAKKCILKYYGEFSTPFDNLNSQ